MRLTIVGGPGAGKGTQAPNLCDKLGIPLISVGDILRGAIALQTDLGILARAYVEKGELVPDPTMIQFIRQRLTGPDIGSGWLLDGYPRTAFQAEELDFLLDELGQRLDWAIYLDVPHELLVSRTLARSRADDLPEIVERRIELFQERTIPLVEYYEYKQRLLRIDGRRSVEEVQQDILHQLKAN
ncbi:MAG: adenylate kinase [Cyanobacteriota bacterium]|nr:adenylate kinase [Cyanobacteriota bacterium]